MQMPDYHTPADISRYSFLVTGGAGFIGSHIVDYLLYHGAGRVVVLDNLITGRRQNLLHNLDNPALEFIEGDICDFDTCLQATAVDYVIHQAALGSVNRSVKDPRTTNAVNITGFLNILEAARINQVKRVVFASSSSVYGDDQHLPKVENRTGKPQSPYAVTKYTNELYAYAYRNVYGLNFIGIRYFNIFGPRQNPTGEYAAVIPIFILRILNNQRVYIDGDGTQTRDFTYIENAVQANIKALFTENPDALNRIYNIGTGHNYSIIELYKIIASASGNDPGYTFRESRPGDVKNSLADITLASRYLNYKPQIKLNEGIQRTIEFYRSEVLS